MDDDQLDIPLLDWYIDSNGFIVYFDEEELF